jgi:hypothetical protein
MLWLLFWRLYPQHFDTPNGYWSNKATKCVPIKDKSPQADWRNYIVKEVIEKEGLHRINQSIIAVHDAFAELPRLHIFGDYRDCTHYCWTPLLYQCHYLRMNEIIAAKLSGAR